MPSAAQNRRRGFEDLVEDLDTPTLGPLRHFAEPDTRGFDLLARFARRDHSAGRFDRSIDTLVSRLGR